MSITGPAIVTLRTGARVPATAVITTSIVLKRLLETDLMAFIEAVEVARDPDHEPFDRTGMTLRECHFLDSSGRMLPVVRDVILASTEGEGGKLALVSPYASDSATEVQP